MEDLDLIEFSSPHVISNAPSPVRNTFSNSPGSNPFDVFSKLAENVPCESFMELEPPFQANIHKSASIVEDFLNCGRDSFGFDIFEELPRESLGILKIEVLNTTLDEIASNLVSSAQVFDYLDNTDTMQLNLNTAFLCPPSYCDYKASFLSSSASISPVTLDFHSGSLECSLPSKIYSFNSSQLNMNFDLFSKTENILNDAFISSIESSLPQKDYTRLRLFSMPELYSVRKRIDDLLSKSQSQLNWKVAVNKEPTDVNTSKLGDSDDAFNDSVFIEAKHFASKLADGSIYDTECFEDNLLDYTSPPTFEDDPEQCQPAELNTENIFKSIDKMIPSSEDQNIMIVSSDGKSNENEASASDMNKFVTVKEQNSSMLKQNLSNIFNKSGSSSNSSSKNANELLHNLSEIINNEKRDLKQNLEGQKLLFGLADILCSNTSSRCPIDSLDDSGHSSIEHDEHQTESDNNCYEVLDLRVPNKSAGSEQGLDLSVKSNLHSQSFSFPCTKAGPLPLSISSKLRSSCVSTGSSLEHSKINGLGSVKLKPKRVEDNVALKKGPLKAVIPVGSMLKFGNSFEKTSPVTTTPPKMEYAQSSMFKVKRTSTPIMEPTLKPMAQSTPDGPSSELENPKSYNAPRVLTKPKSYSASSSVPKQIGTVSYSSPSHQLNKSSPRTSSPNLSNHSSLPTLTRRHSESELKANKTSTLRRSYSIGKGSQIKNNTEKTKQNVLGTKNVAQKKTAGSGIQKSVVLQEKNRGIMSNIKPFSLLNKMKKNKVDKENLYK